MFGALNGDRMVELPALEVVRKPIHQPKTKRATSAGSIFCLLKLFFGHCNAGDVRSVGFGYQLGRCPVPAADIANSILFPDPAQLGHEVNERLNRVFLGPPSLTSNPNAVVQMIAPNLPIKRVEIVIMLGDIRLCDPITWNYHRHLQREAMLSSPRVRFFLHGITLEAGVVESSKSCTPIVMKLRLAGSSCLSPFDEYWRSNPRAEAKRPTWLISDPEYPVPEGRETRYRSK